MSYRLSFLMALARLAWSVPHFEYRAIGLRDENNRTSSVPSAAGTGTMPMVTETNVFNLSSYCDAQSSSFLASYDPTGKLTTTTRTWYSGVDDTGDQTGSIVSQHYSTATITYTREGYQAYADGGAKPPCCSTCQMSAGTIQFYWWPDLASPTPTPTVAASANGNDVLVTAVAPNGFTFTSPSVYMAFSSLYAHNQCGTVGDVWYNTTIGFRPDEISTINAYKVTYSSWITTTADGETVSELTTRGTQPPPSPLTYKDLAQNCSSIPGYVYFPDDPQNDGLANSKHDPCHPLIAIPDSLIDKQQAWADNHCQAVDGYGAYDPPQALTAAEAEAKPTLSMPAQPGSTGSPSSAPATTTYTAQPDTEPTSSAVSSSSAQTSETTIVDGGGSSSSSIAVFPSPVVASSETGLDTASRSDGPTLKSPDVQHSASELDTPSRTSIAVAVTSEDSQDQSPSSRAYRPQEESSQTGLTVPGNTNGPAEEQTYTLVQPTGIGPAQSPVTNQSPTQAPVIVVAGHTYTADTSSNFIVYGQTIPAHGATVTIDNTPVAVFSKTMPLATTPAAIAAPSITIGNDVLGASAAGVYVVSPGTTLSVGGSPVTVDNTAYALTTNSAGETMLVVGAVAASTSSVDIGHYIMSAIGANRTSTSSSSTTHHSTTTSSSRTSSETAAASTISATGDATVAKSGSAVLFGLMLTLIAML